MQLQFHDDLMNQSFCVETNLARGQLSSQTFPLPPELITRIKAVNETVYNGQGFVVLRGLDPKRYTEDESVILYAGITSHIANRRGNTLGKNRLAPQIRACLTLSFQRSHRRV